MAAAKKPSNLKYGVSWPEGTSALEVEIYCIRRGGEFTEGGKKYGLGLFHHYKELQKILWPWRVHHRWSDLFLHEILRNKMVGMIGPASSGKSHYAISFALCNYWCFPENTFWMISSTTLKKLESGIWGEAKMLYQRAVDLHGDEHLAGQVIDHKQCIATDVIEEGQTRDLRKGIKCFAAEGGDTYKSLANFLGTKQTNLGLIADECSLMGPGFLSATANLKNAPNWKFVPIGNPVNGEFTPLGRACEPEDGWGSLGRPAKTVVFKTRMPDGVCINYIGADSVNFDYPQDQPPKFNFLIHRRTIETTLKFWGEHSEEYNAQCIGWMRSGESGQTVLTKTLCRQHNAQDRVVWSGRGKIIKIYALDAAFLGIGGDRCAGGHIEFGEDVNEIQKIKARKPNIIRPGVIADLSPEDEIAVQVKIYCDGEGIPAECIFYDSTGRGSLGAAFAKIYGNRVPVPVEFGGRPTARPVRMDLYSDERDGTRRLKRCDEHYFNRVSEIWFSVNMVVICDQMGEMPEDVIEEFCMRKWKMVGGNKVQIEPKEETKLRLGRSPDLADWLAIGIEGARQKGFRIERLGSELVGVSEDKFAFNRIQEAYDEAMNARMPVYR